MNEHLKNETWKETLERIQKLSPAQKIILAQKGTLVERKILARDNSIDVLLALINSVKVTEPEIERMASLAATPEVVLKAIYSSSRWQKSLRIKVACLKHPRLPAAQLRRVLAGLSKQHLKNLIKDPAVPIASREAAKRMLT